MSMRFSVIVTSYNYATYIKAALDSVASADAEDFELIVVDDGSSDESQQIIQEWLKGFKKPSKFLKLNREGQATALNRAYEISVGNYLVFLDADDTFFPYKLSDLDAFICKNPNYGFIHHDLVEIDANGNPLGSVFGVNTSATGCVLKDGNVLRNNLLDLDNPYSWYFAPTSGFCLRRDYAEKIFPLPSRFSICADVPIAYRAAVIGEVGLIEKPLGSYRLHSNSGYASTLRRKPAAWFAEQFVNVIERYALLVEMRSDSVDGVLRHLPLPRLDDYEKFWEFYFRVIHPSIPYSILELIRIRLVQVKEGKSDILYSFYKTLCDVSFLCNSNRRREYCAEFYRRLPRLGVTSRLVLSEH